MDRYRGIYKSNGSTKYARLALAAVVGCVVSVGASAADFRTYTTSGVQRGGSVRMEKAETHICMLTGVSNFGRTPGGDSPQIRRSGDYWQLDRGGRDDDPVVWATCYAHNDFFARTGGVGKKQYWNEPSRVSVSTGPEDACQDGRTLSTGEYSGVLYMRGVYGEFQDNGTAYSTFRSAATIKQATSTSSGTTPTKSQMTLHISECEAAAIGLLGFYIPGVDYWQDGHFQAGWYKIGNSLQMAKFIRRDGRRVFPVDSGSEFSVSLSRTATAASAETEMAVDYLAACYLTNIGGNFGPSGGHKVSILNRGGRWVLRIDGRGIQASARCYAYDQSELYSGPSPG